MDERTFSTAETRYNQNGNFLRKLEEFYVYLANYYFNENMQLDIKTAVN
jgi:hypothetical protein